MLSKSVEDDFVYFTLKFDKQMMVSIASISPDTLIATIIDASLFCSAESFNEIDENFIMEKVLPRMLPGEEFAVTLDKAGKTAE